MIRIQIVSLILALFTFMKVIGTQELVNQQSDDSNLKEKVSFLESTVYDLVKVVKDVNDELDHLKQLSKLNTVRTCEEMKEYGVNESDFYLVDPDGPLIGHEPIMVYCDFKDGQVSTKVSHNSEERIMVHNCKDPGCYSRKIIYNAPMEQMLSLIQLSNSCSQGYI